VSSSGVSGVTFEVGHGYIARGYFLATGNLIEVNMVLFDGSYITASQ